MLPALNRRTKNRGTKGLYLSLTSLFFENKTLKDPYFLRMDVFISELYGSANNKGKKVRYSPEISLRT